jgi:hypothetical protein
LVLGAGANWAGRGLLGHETSKQASNQDLTQITQIRIKPQITQKAILVAVRRNFSRATCA